MNIFRLAGDMSHLLAIVILLVKIWKTRSCAGMLTHLLFTGGLVFNSSKGILNLKHLVILFL